MKAVTSPPVLLCHLVQARCRFLESSQLKGYPRGKGERELAVLAVAASLLEHVQHPALKTSSFAPELTARSPGLPQLPGKWVTGAPTGTTPFRQRKEVTPASYILDKCCNHWASAGKNRCCPCQVWKKGLVSLQHQPAGKDVGSRHCVFAVWWKACNMVRVKDMSFFLVFSIS